MQKTVELLKASAGAGKTTFLTDKYIEMLLSGGEDSYRHILAVTFTNKATEEMKSRIVEKLSEIASDASDPHCAAARRRLTRILHDYSGFSVSTIDSFFQGVLRAFAREVGQYASYRVELDQGAVLSQAVDMMLDSLADAAGGDLLEWLKAYSLHLISEGKSWNLRGPLEEMAGLLFKEDFKLMLREAGDIPLGDRVALRELESRLDGMISTYETQTRRIGRSAMRLLGEKGLSWDDFQGKSRTKIRLFEKWAEGGVQPATEALYDSLKKMDDGALPELRRLIAEAVELSSGSYRNYRTACIIKKNFYLLGIYSDIYHHLHEFLAAGNIVLLGETTDILSRIIDGSDTPFVYEKIGNRYDHIMLDESQDTSVLQWDNFKSLFLESVSKGCSSLIVGDIKQSIYRWRGSDWRLISDYVYRDLGADNVEDYSDGDNPLKYNWRSASAIVEFNNTLFSEAGDYIAAENPAAGEGVKAVYSGCGQLIPPVKAGAPEGRVKIDFLSGDDAKSWKKEAMERTVADIRQLSSRGYRCKDIAVLVRTNNEGGEIAKYLIKEGFDVVTEDSLLIGASPCVASVLGSLSCKADPGTPANKLLALEGIEAAEYSGGSLYELCEKMIADLPGGVPESQVSFVSAFLDCVLSYQTKYGSSLRGFVRWWDEAGCKKSICAPEGRNAIRVMTIHKSKGLGLEAVIVPFLEEPFVAKGFRAPTIWCRPGEEFSDVGLIPVKVDSSLDETVFRDDYRREQLYEYVDVVNTVYVAFTRARSQLIVYAPAPAKPGDYKISTFANLLFKHLGGAVHTEIGSMADSHSGSKVVESRVLSRFLTVPLGERLTVATRWEDYFDESMSPRTRGIALHDILSKVELSSDLASACGGDREAFEYLSQRMLAVEGKHWFDGTYESLNEASIILPDGSVQRPDRVLVSRGAAAAVPAPALAPVPGSAKAVVIDYKFGRPREKYNLQVEQYCSLIRDMGYASVEGWLWYVDSDTAERVV